MMAKGSSKKLVQRQEKLVKKKARPKKDTQNAPEHDKVKTKSSGNDVHSPLGRIRGAQKERNVAQQINKQQKHIPLQTRKLQVSEVTKKEQSQVGQRKITRSPAQEIVKKSEVKVLRRRQYSSVTSNNRNKPTLRTSAENQAIARTTTSRAQALLVEVMQRSRLSIPGAQQHGLSALATELNFEQKSAEVVDNKKVPRGEGGEGLNSRKDGGEGEGLNSRKEGGVGKCRNHVQEDDVAEIVTTEVSESTEPRFITPKEVSLFEDWRPGSQKIDKPPCVDKNHWLRVEMEKQQELRMAQKKATRKKELSNLRRLEGANADDVNNITPLSIYSSQSIANSTIREDVEESARGYAKFLYRPGAAWQNLGSDSASTTRSFGLLEVIESRPKSCDSRKSTTEIVQAISMASARREVMRKDIAGRIREDLLRKKLLITQNRAAARAHSQCKCCKKWEKNSFNHC